MGYPSKRFEESHIKETILEKIRFNISRELSELDLHFGFKVEQYSNHATANFIHQIKMDILGERDKKEVKIPSSWWQMFKQEYVPQWFLKRYPVQSKYIGLFDYCVLYPHLKCSLPGERRYVSVTNFELFPVEDNIAPNFKKLLIDE